ncbi:Glutamine-dependent NAD(+) synthetase [Acaryochloris thomasi RCC1774]|uniref:Glutamine-dependent NAD(+) synthetase n=1 Tax=Acaryochloris thomasi RCC1774 TaxID=1764569 RepID=A0A2W1JVE1_9CYAN|nr:NAD+ synthase [Acaryochloris thomasi]PZD72731.1 Glutamine-dependent NAD(+) synthetase [Acaryochloris thomasi RCC1774]
MKLAIAQLNPTIGDLSGNVQQIIERSIETAGQGAELMLTPELSLCGYPPRDLLLNPSFIEAMTAALQEIAAKVPSHLMVLVGFAEPNPQAPEVGSKPLYNSMACIKAGQVRQVIRKRLLPTYDVFDEDRYFASGEQPGILDCCGLKLGVTICEDLWNDEQFWGHRSYTVNPIAELVERQVDLIVNLSASPFVIGKQRVREAMLTHSAQRHGCPIVYVNQLGGNDDLIFDGRSVAVDIQGSIAGRAQAFKTDLLCIKFDSEKKTLRSSISHPLEGDHAEIWAALVLGVQDYARKCGFTQAVLGLSGGIDSALVGAIATAALGPENVLGVLMPSPYSSDHSIKDAQDLAVNLGFKTEVIPIADLMGAYDQSLSCIFSDTEPGIAEENIQARIRGAILMAIANKFGRLLISTGNKSELAVGYCTLYGDMSGGLAAISDVPKTRVYSLCRWLNSEAGQQAFNAQSSEIIPKNILTKPPSAELKPNQVDQDSLPPYDQLDDILARIVDQHQSQTQIVAAGHAAAIVQRVMQLVHRAEFKRRQAPPGLKITDRAFGTGWRMPIAAKH